LTSQDDEIDLSEVSAVWHRRLNVGGRLPTEIYNQLRGASQIESRATLMGMIASLRCFYLDAVTDIREAQNKQLQLEVAQRLGLAIPQTLITNDPDSVRKFYRRLDGNVVAKMLPQEIQTRLQEFLDYFGLQYGAFDLILTPDGQYVFLELNPSGEFFWLDSVVGLPISKAIADVLLGEHRRPLR
jgi:glutathione synthase/RimK-type ligase-like ATP-grasp enzyme